MSPTQFVEFRKALAACIDRKKINQLALRGNADIQMYGNLFSSAHPWFAPEDQLYKMADSPEGSKEQARKFLEDAGWGWDSDGNLRYPKEKDLTPPWPKGETPSAEDFPCLENI
jgi:peptide/nickel transport system substrate-binding protein